MQAGETPMEESSAAKRRSSCFDPRYLWVAMVAAVVIIAAALVARGNPPGSMIRIAMALVQGLATTVVIVMPWWGLRRLDELQQRIQLEALALAFFGTGVLAAFYGFLENAGLPKLDWGGLTWPVMVVLWAGGMVIATRRYR